MDTSAHGRVLPRQATHGAAYGTPRASAHGTAVTPGTPGTPGSAGTATPGVAGTAPGPAGHAGAVGAAGESGARLRVDARRNLESVLRAAREVFGELGYGAPMEEVARRAGVGVGTVYRRFPSKDVLVQRIAAEEVGWLTGQAREALAGDRPAWDALAGYLARAVSSGAGRLLPPEAFRYAEAMSRGSGGGRPAGAGARQPAHAGQPSGAVDERLDDADPTELLHLLDELVERARKAGELRPGVTVWDVVLVLTASIPAYALPAAPAGTPQRAGAGNGAAGAAGTATGNANGAGPNGPMAAMVPAQTRGSATELTGAGRASVAASVSTVAGGGSSAGAGGSAGGPAGVPAAAAGPSAATRLLRILLDGLRAGGVEG